MEPFSSLLALCAGNSPVTVNSPHKGQWRGAFMVSLICAWINGWVNNRETGDLRRHYAHYDVIVTIQTYIHHTYILHQYGPHINRPWGWDRVSVVNLTPWGWATYICDGDLCIGWDNGADIHLYVDLLSVGPMGTNFDRFLIKIRFVGIWLQNMHLKMSSAKCRPFYLVGFMLKQILWWQHLSWLNGSPTLHSCISSIVIRTRHIVFTIVSWPNPETRVNDL